MTRQRLLLIITCAIIVLLLLLAAEFIYVQRNGTAVPAPTIPRAPQILGSGPALTYVVMGDSTSIGQGTDYAHSYALNSAEHLAEHYTVTFVNVGISGATAKTVLSEQAAKAAGYKPSLVLLAVGANDATHFTSGKSLQTSLQRIITILRVANSQVQIVVTGSPAMDSVSRFPVGAKQIMGLRTHQINRAFEPIIAKNRLVLAPIAEKTRAAFLADPTLTASDNFHPNARGYALWIPIINHALDQALEQK